MKVVRIFTGLARLIPNITPKGRTTLKYQINENGANLSSRISRNRILGRASEIWLAKRFSIGFDKEKNRNDFKPITSSIKSLQYTNWRFNSQSG